MQRRHLFFLCLIVLLCIVPPLSTVIHHGYVQLWPVAGVLRISDIIAGSHHALLTRAAVRIGLFDALADVDGVRASNQPSFFSLPSSTCVIDSLPFLPWRAPLIFYSAFSGVQQPCMKTAWIFSELGTRKSQKTAAHGERRRFNAAERHSIVLLLNALASIGLVEQCPCSCVADEPEQLFPPKEETDGLCFRNSFHTAMTLPSNAPSLMRLAGMADSANAHELVAALSQLDKKLTKGAKTNQNKGKEDDAVSTVGSGLHYSLSDQSMDSLWEGFATSTSDVFRPLAEQVGRTIVKEVLWSWEEEDGKENVGRSSRKVWVADMGAGSGVYSEELQRVVATATESGQQQSALNFALFDLPSVASVLSTRYSSKAEGSNDDTENSEHQEAFQPQIVEGNAFTKEDRERLMGLLNNDGKTDTVIMMNSFLQHFSRAECVALLRSLIQEHHREGRRRFAIVVSELTTPSDDAQFNPWTETSSSPRVFSAVLRAFTDHGEVRSAAQYESIFDSAVLDTPSTKGEPKRTNKPSLPLCSDEARQEKGSSFSCCRSTHSVVPLPANIFILKCVSK